MSNKKWIEVMTFDQKNEPVFGGQYFNYQQDSLKRATQYRYSLEYKKEARAILKYDEDSKLIIVDHLISETDEPDNKWTYVPDGDYEAFKWQNGVTSRCCACHVSSRNRQVRASLRELPRRSRSRIGPQPTTGRDLSGYAVDRGGRVDSPAHTSAAASGTVTRSSTYAQRRSSPGIGDEPTRRTRYSPTSGCRSSPPDPAAPPARRAGSRRSSARMRRRRSAGRTLVQSRRDTRPRRRAPRGTRSA